MEMHEREEIWVRRELEMLDGRLRKIDEEIGYLPEGNLLYLQHGKSRKLARSLIINGKRQIEYLTSTEKRSIAHGLARKEYIKAESKILKNNIKALEKLGKAYKEPSRENILKMLPAKKQIITAELTESVNAQLPDES